MTEKEVQLLGFEREDYSDYDGDTYKIHPLPLLVLDKYKKSGGGDYFGTNQQLCGSWSRDVISLEKEIPVGFNQLICDFNVQDTRKKFLNN